MNCAFHFNQRLIMIMDLARSQKLFKELLHGVDKSFVPSFMKWVRSTADEYLKDVDSCTMDVMMRHIQDDLRQSVPNDAILPSEHIVFPKVGPNADCDPATTVHVDGFLYDDETVDDLCEQGKMSRNYCKQCGSHETSPLTFISHSTSITQLKYMFQFLLPDLHGKTVVDVGSRIGAVLYGGYFYSSAAHVVGIEINPDLCSLQKRVSEKYELQDKCQVICADVLTQSAVLQTADVVIMNNLLEFFCPIETQQRIWLFLFETLRKPGTLLVLSPSIEDSLQPLQTIIPVHTWLKPVWFQDKLAMANLHLFGSANSEDSDLTDIYLYEVL